MSGEFIDAKRAMATADGPTSDLCSPFLSIVPATGAAVSVLAGLKGQSTVCASDATAARLDELQFDLGEGPCWSAMSARSPVLAPRMRDDRERWPMFSEALRGDPRAAEVRSMFAFPLALGALDIGAVDLYSVAESELAGEQVDQVSQLANIAAWQVLRRIFADEMSDADDGGMTAAGSRREVHQATGMILAQLDIDADDAVLLLRAHAFAVGRSVQDVARDVVSRKLDFSRS